MKWTEFNDLFEQTHVRGHYEVIHPEKAKAEENLSPFELLKKFTFSVNDSYDWFVKTNKRDFENNNSNFIIDFDPCVICHDYSGFMRFWVEVKESVPFNRRTGHLGNIPLDAIFFELNWENEIKKNQLNKTPIIKIELIGNINPEHWHGRNKLNLARAGVPFYTGLNRIVNEKLELSRHEIINRFEFSRYFYKGLNYFFL